ncbi:hypothetical protein B0H14DRAFT_3623943 [Mycena olivaceomarginata]|nr:hypothetical protein B0H14DRAFT_3623943 [Mycena olivaceomarginata]
MSTNQNSTERLLDSSHPPQLSLHSDTSPIGAIQWLTSILHSQSHCERMRVEAVTMRSAEKKERTRAACSHEAIQKFRRKKLRTDGETDGHTVNSEARGHSIRFSALIRPKATIRMALRAGLAVQRGATSACARQCWIRDISIDESALGERMAPPRIFFLDYGHSGAKKTTIGDATWTTSGLATNCGSRIVRWQVRTYRQKKKKEKKSRVWRRLGRTGSHSTVIPPPWFHEMELNRRFDLSTYKDSIFESDTAPSAKSPPPLRPNQPTAFQIPGEFRGRTESRRNQYEDNRRNSRTCPSKFFATVNLPGTIKQFCWKQEARSARRAST